MAKDGTINIDPQKAEEYAAAVKSAILTARDLFNGAGAELLTITQNNAIAENLVEKARYSQTAVNNFADAMAESISSLTTEFEELESFFSGVGAVLSDRAGMTQDTGYKRDKIEVSGGSASLV